MYNSAMEKISDKQPLEVHILATFSIVFSCIFCRYFVARFWILEIAGFGKKLLDYPALPESGTSLIVAVLPVIC